MAKDVGEKAVGLPDVRARHCEDSIEAEAISFRPSSASSGEIASSAHTRLLAMTSLASAGADEIATGPSGPSR